MLATAAVSHASSPIALWYLARGTGIVTLLLLTLTVTLGVANANRLHTRRIPRFVVDGIHRNASLLAVAFLAVHVLTTLADAYIQVRLVDVFVPFTGSYRPFWLGLGALSLDLFVAVLITSLLRRRIGHRIWRATHWMAYASWPVAVFHSLGTGSDAGSTWMRVIVGACVVIVGAAASTRLPRSGDAPAPALRPTPRPGRERDPVARRRRPLAPAAGRR